MTGGTGERLRALLIEDERLDAGLILRALAQAGFAVEHRIVHDGEGLRAALDSERWDVVLSDHVLPGFGSEEALEIVAGSGVEVPFIVVSGRIGEEAVAAGLRAGAMDYISKENLAPLGAAVRRCRGESVLKQRQRVTQEALRLAEEQFRGAFDNAPIGMALVATDGRWLRVNRQLCEMVGYEEADLLTRTFQDVTHPEDLDADLAFVRQLLAGEITAYQMEKRYIRRTGEEIWVHLAVSLVRDASGSPRHFVSHIKDISDRKRAELALRESEARLQAIFDHAPAGISLRGLDGRYVQVNQYVARSLGTTPEALVGVDPAVHLDPDVARRVRAEDQAMIDSREPLEDETTVANPDGSVRHFHIVRYPVRDPVGQVTGFGAFSLDITDRTRAEGARAQALASLEEAQRLAQIGSWAWDPHCDAGVWSAEMFRLLGRDRARGPAPRDEFIRYVTPGDRPRVARAYAEMLAAGGSFELEYSVVRDDGEMRMLHALGAPDPVEPGRYVGTMQDVTELRAIEHELLASRQELAHSTARLQAMVDHAPASIVMRDADGRYEHVSRTAAESLGIPARELVGRTPADHYPAELAAVIREQDAKVIETREPMIDELEVPTADGTMRAFQVVKYPVLDEAGALSGLGSFSIDITDRKRAEQQLLAREHELREAHRLARLGTWEWALEEPQGRWSDEVCQIFGHPAGFRPTYEEFLAQIHPDDRVLIQERTEQRAAEQDSETECRIARPDGTIRHIHLRRFGRQGPDGSVTHVFGTVQDITERREAELRADIARDQAEAITAAMAEGYALTIDTQIVTVNDALCQMTGFSRDELIGQGAPFPFWPPETRAQTWALRDQVVATEGGTFELTLMRKDGTRFEAELTARPARNPDGTVLGYVTTFRDVSERNRHIAEIERDRRELNEAQAVAAIGSWDYDLVTDRAGRWSRELWRILGLEPRPQAPTVEEFHTMVHPEDRSRVADALAEARERDEPWDGEFRMIAADGRERIVSYRAEHTHDEHGRQVTAYGTLQDITDRAQRDAEERALRRIAELVAANAGAAAVFAAVALETQRLFRAHSGLVYRYDQPAGQAILISGQRFDGQPLEQSAYPLVGASAVAEVWRTKQPARIDTDSSQGGATGRHEVTGRVAAPVLVGGKLWGTIEAAFAGAPVPLDAEQRLSRFGRLMAMAISNAETWELLTRQAATDSLTGLANHRIFQERLRSEVTRARRYRRDLSLVLVDIDHFKQINDTHGHQTGDRVLAELGRRLAEHARGSELVARIGGEEFAWLMPETDRGGAYQAAERLRRIIESEPFERAGTVTVSCGVCAIEHGFDPDDLVRFADRALYWAKDGGRNATFLYTDEAHAILAQQERTVERFQAMSSVRALARAIDSKDVSTREHSERVAALAERLALHLGWTAKPARLLHACGLLHDVGKIGIPDEILLKPGRLTESEYEQIKRHAELSARIAAEVLEAEQVTWIRGHHERWDGSGYPDQLAGENIPDGAQLLALADAYDVMTESRTYQPQRTQAEALAECQAQSGQQFAPTAVQALLTISQCEQPSLVDLDIHSADPPALDR